MKRFYLLTALLASLLLLPSCSSSNDSSSSTSSSYSASSGSSGSSSFQMQHNMTESDSSPEAELVAPQSLSSQDLLPAKLVYSGLLHLETTEFDHVIDSLHQLLEEHHAYLEWSSIDQYSAYRSGFFTIRVPSHTFSPLHDQIKDLAFANHSSTSVEDISTQYYDTQGRLDTQLLKLERLQSLLAQAVNMEDLITIESAISETQWMIDVLSGEMNQYDSLVNYATLEISMKEVYKLSLQEEAPATFGERISYSFTRGYQVFLQNTENLFVHLVFNWANLLLSCVTLFLVYQFGKKPFLKFKNKKNKTHKNNHDENQPPPTP